VVAAGLVNGNLGTRGMSPTTRIVLTNFWEYLAFLSNSLVFVLIGMSVEFDMLVRFAWPALLAVVAVLAARAITTYGSGTILRLFKRPLELRYLHVMTWGGLRGAVSLALVLSLPFAIPERSELLAMTFAVVLFTLLAQATTLPLLLKRLGLAGRPKSLGYERLQGQLLAIRAAERHLDHLYAEGAVVPPVRDTVRAELAAREKSRSTEMQALLSEHPELETQILNLTRLEVLRAERAALDELARDGMLGDEAMGQLMVEVDEALAQTENHSEDEPV
jgi:CPA1 family monovalent cation:H+ antiporter